MYGPVVRNLKVDFFILAFPGWTYPSQLAHTLESRDFFPGLSRLDN